MIAELTKEHIVDECFLERIRQREEKHATIFDSEIGFPHAINDQTDKIVLSIGVFKRKLVTPEGNIKLIMMNYLRLLAMRISEKKSVPKKIYWH